MSTISKTLKTGILGGIAAIAMSASAFAGGDLTPVTKSACGLSANVALTTDYVFRGESQTDEDAAIQGGVDVECGIFYAGVWGSNVDFGDDDTTAEFDFYAGIKKAYRGITFDVGAIAYTYDDADEIFEIKVGASGEIYKGATLGATAFFETEGDYQVYEVAFEKAFSGNIGPFSPTFSALVGFFEADDSDADYTYWNAGVSLGFAEKFALDLRYHDTDIDNSDLADERFVATLSASF